jgi:hypothetical protein
MPTDERGAVPGEGARTALAIAIATLLLTWPAVYNGYPLLYDDSASYIDTIDPRLAIWARPVFYTLFARPFHMHVTLWPVVIVQALILAHFVHLAARAVLGRIAPRAYLALMAVLSLTMLPWLTSMIMPHAFTGVVVLGLCLLGLFAERLRWWERWYLTALVAAAITFHMSHLALAACTILAIVAVQLVRLAPRPALARGAVLAIPLALAIVAETAVNSYAQGRLAFAPATPTFLLGRLVGDGTAVTYLREACPERKFRLCRYLDQFPPTSDEFLWSKTGPFRRLGGPQALQAESRAIVFGTLHAYPLRQLAITARHVARQLFDWRIDSIVPTPDTIERADSPLRAYMEGLFPREYPDFLASRVGTNSLPLAAIDRLHATLTVVSFAAGLLAVIAFARRRETRMVGLAAVIVAAWIGNAIVTASVSGVFGHYQGRLAWVVTVYAVAAALCLARDRVGIATRGAPA